MTNTQLRTFVEVAATGSIREAAERLVVTPPAVSAALSALQRELGVALVVREGRGCWSAQPGSCSRYARQLLGSMEEAKGTGSFLERYEVVTSAGLGERAQ